MITVICRKWKIFKYDSLFCRPPPPHTRCTCGGAVLSSKQVNGRCQVRFLVQLVDPAVRSFSLFFRNSRKYRLESLRIPHGGHTTYSTRSHKRTIRLKTTTNKSPPDTHIHALERKEKYACYSIETQFKSE